MLFNRMMMTEGTGQTGPGPERTRHCKHAPLNDHTLHHKARIGCCDAQLYIYLGVLLVLVGLAGCVHVASSYSSPDDPQDVPDYGEHEIERHGQQQQHNEQYNNHNHNYDTEDELDNKATNGEEEQENSRPHFEDEEEEEAREKEKCDIKRCSLMFRQATLSHDLSYDMDTNKIDSMCVTFNRAVECFNEYRRVCLANETYYANKITSATIFDQISEGPLGLTMELCNNNKFKQDYLTLGPCQKRYRGQFDQCLRMSTAPAPTKVYPGYGPPLQHNPRTKLEMFIENCCALHYYHNCIYDISLNKCGKDAAEFSLKILELFNRGYLRDCEKYADLKTLCPKQGYVSLGATGPHPPNLLVIGSLLGTIFACLSLDWA